jgi:Domain of unknown function (DUF6430)
MNHSELLKRITIGVKKNPLRLLINTFFAYATAWAILEPVIAIVPATVHYFSGGAKFVVLILISLGVGIYRSAIPNRISIKYGNSSITVLFGDLFSFNGFQTIPVSRYFFETKIVPTSLQHKLINMFVQSRESCEGLTMYNDLLSAKLQGIMYDDIYRDATRMQEKYYPLGTTVTLELGCNIYMLFSLTETELKGHIPKDNCNLARMWVALGKFWEEARVHGRGNSVNIPLIGSGVSGVKLKPTQLLEVNLLAIANAIEEDGKITTEEIRVVLHPKYMEDIDLRDFQNIWNV